MTYGTFKQVFFKDTFILGMVSFYLFGISVRAEQLTVIDSRGYKAAPGSTIDSTKPITLKEGEKITLIRADGNTVTLKGPFSDLPMPAKASGGSGGSPLASLVTSRDAKVNTVGAIRAGTTIQPIPKPWLMDVSYSGTRCWQDGMPPVFWRPDNKKLGTLSIAPIDKSYKLDLSWPKDESTLEPEKVGFRSLTETLVVTLDGQDFNLQIVEIPKEVQEETMLTGWMLEKGCFQQADAMLKLLQQKSQ
jgi:hypothetical protein